MSIEEFRNVRKRVTIAFIGRAPDDACGKYFEKLGFTVIELSEADLTPNRLALVDSVVLFQDAAKPSAIHHLLERVCRPLMEQGCRIYVGPADGKDSAHFRKLVINAAFDLELPVVGVDHNNLRGESRGDEQQPVHQPCVHILTQSTDWNELARLITCNPAEVSASAVTVEAVDYLGKPIDLDPETKTLVRRAFFDCAHVRLIREVDGLSQGINVYRAYAQLVSGAMGRYPYLHFAKVGKRSTIEKEFQRYRSTAMEYVPFHLGPRLRQDRCALGYSKGIIVGDYVTGAEKLRDCAKAGRAAHVIANLFNHTLRAWRVTAQESDVILADALGEYWRKDLIPEWREPEIRRLGGKRSLWELKQLFMRAARGKVLSGSVHGDLHATNVLARLSDGIVIDFEKVELNRPLLYDPASLEAGLFIDGFIGDPRSPEQVLDSIMPLYGRLCFTADDAVCHPGDRSAWFYDCAYQIRMHAKRMERMRYQYGATLALCFIQKSCNWRNFSDEAGPGLSRETVRAMAFVLGERILEELVPEQADA